MVQSGTPVKPKKMTIDSGLSSLTDGSDHAARRGLSLYLVGFLAFYVGLTLSIGYAHYLIGFTPDFTILYLVPIVLAAGPALQFRRHCLYGEQGG